MSQTNAIPRPRRFGEIHAARCLVGCNRWPIFLGFSAFIVYSTWAAFQGVADIHNHACNYWFGGNGANYLSPFYSPEFWGTSPHAIGKLPAWWPAWAPFSPAFLILWIPAGFSFHLLLLSRRLLQGLLGRSASTARLANRAKTFLGEHSFPRSSFKMSTAIFSTSPSRSFIILLFLRCVAGDVVYGCRKPASEHFWHRRWHGGDDFECGFPGDVHFRLSFRCGI